MMSIGKKFVYKKKAITMRVYYFSFLLEKLEEFAYTKWNKSNYLCSV